MATKIEIPSVGESVESGVIAAWSVGDGEYVERDQTVLELETDKVTMEVPAPASGIVTHSAAEGDEVAVGAVVGEIDESAERPASGSASGSKEKAKGGADEDATTPPDDAATVTATREPPPDQKESPAGATPSSDGAGGGDDTSVKATPLARKLASDRAVDLSKISGTGTGGRVREQDVLAFIQSRQNGPAASAAQSEAAPRTGSRETTLERMSPMRQKIASRLVEAQQTAAMLTTFNEVDMGAVMELRKKYKEPFSERHGIGLGFMSFFVKASVRALQKFPMVNAYITKGEDEKPAILKHAYQDVAIAVAGPKGLVVPVIRDAQTLSFARIEEAIKDFGTRAKDGKLDLSEMTGGTFTITNGGVFGSLLSTPILNPPQSAILGMHGIKSRPAEDPDNPGQVAMRPMMYLALSYDHRIVDGADAVQFLVSIKESIEDPSRLMLEL